ncbi:MAG: hypothetical protein Q9174_003460 [Haloplaca sp. 1 TL-2023]
MDVKVTLTSSVILDIIFDYALNKLNDSVERLSLGRPKFLAVIDRFVVAGVEVKMCLPAFPFKSANKIEKVFGILPDKAEELALERLNSMCNRIRDVYPPGAKLTIVSDGITYNGLYWQFALTSLTLLTFSCDFSDLLNISDRETWAYGESLRSMASEKGFSNIEFARLKDLVKFKIPLPEKMEEITYVANATNFRRYLFNQFGKDDLDIDHEIGTNTDTQMTYLGYRRFLESDLRYIFGHGRSNHSYKKGVRYLAKQMLIRGYAFAGAVKAAFPEYLRLSIHQSTGEHKVSMSLLNTKTGYTTPWHCTVAQMLNGDWVSGTMSDFMKNKALEIVHENGRPSYFKEKAMTSFESPALEDSPKIEATAIDINGQSTKFIAKTDVAVEKLLGIESRDASYGALMHPSCAAVPRVLHFGNLRESRELRLASAWCRFGISIEILVSTKPVFSGTSSQLWVDLKRINVQAFIQMQSGLASSGISNYHLYISNMAKVKYIPSQTDPLVGSSVSALHNSPSMLFLHDLRVLASNLQYLPYILLPLIPKTIDDELNPFRAGAWVLLLQALVFTVQATLVALLIPAFLFLPGLVFLYTAIASLAFLYIILRVLDWPRVIHSTAGCATESQGLQHLDERWIFINGCVVGHPILRRNIDRLSRLFGRKITGIHNRTYGTFGDLLDCLLQRCYDYKSSGVRTSYRHIKAVLLDPEVTKVVLIGHSQGGIILSLVIDQLFAELPTACMSKIEIYTFGSAASHFSNPLISAPRSPDDAKTSEGDLKSEDHPPRHVISHIEHYANEFDLVCRWGTLHSTEGHLNYRYAGSVFVRMGATGHMLNQHYLDFMFPIPGEAAPADAQDFLDSTLITDEGLAVERESTAATNATQNSQNGNGKLETVKHGVARDTHRRRTVRSVSRLWKYQDGLSP